MSNRHFAAMRTILGVSKEISRARPPSIRPDCLAHSGRHHSRRHRPRHLGLNTTFNNLSPSLKCLCRREQPRTARAEPGHI